MGAVAFYENRIGVCQRVNPWALGSGGMGLGELLGRSGVILGEHVNKMLSLTCPDFSTIF